MKKGILFLFLVVSILPCFAEEYQYDLTKVGTYMVILNKITKLSDSEYLEPYYIDEDLIVLSGIDGNGFRFYDIRTGLYLGVYGKNEDVKHISRLGEKLFVYTSGNSPLLGSYKNYQYTFENKVLKTKIENNEKVEYSGAWIDFTAVDEKNNYTLKLDDATYKFSLLFSEHQDYISPIPYSDRKKIVVIVVIDTYGLE